MNSTAIPDYGWRDREAEGSHAYIDAPILALVDDLNSKRLATRDVLNVFDAGCGNGALLNLLSRRGYVTAGCDASESGVAQARLACERRVHVERLSVYEDMSAVFGSEWDVVIATEVVEHLYDPRLFVRRTLDLLKPGGLLVLSTPYHGYFKNLAMAATGKLDAHFTALWDGGHIKFWSYKTLTRLLAEFHLTDFSFAGAGRIPGLWKSMIVSCRKPLES